MKYKVFNHAGGPGRWGVQAIVYEHPGVNWAVASGGDFYIQLEDRFVAVDRDGMLDWVINQFDKVISIWAGRTISNKEYKEILIQAKEFMKIEKAGWLPYERKPIDD